MMPSRSFEAMMSSDDSTIAASRSFQLRGPPLLRDVPKDEDHARKTWPSSLTMGAALSSMGVSLPS